MRIIQNRRARKLSQRFVSALQAKESRCERDEAFQAEHAPAYEAFGKRVEQADQAARSAAWRACRQRWEKESFFYRPRVKTPPDA